MLSMAASDTGMSDPPLESGFQELLLLSHQGPQLFHVKLRLRPLEH